MAIFRGIGGSGEAETDATVTAVTQLAVEAQASANAAAASATAATNASTQAVANLGLSNTTFDVSSHSEGDGLIFNATNTLVPHTFTTTSLSDIDNTNKQNGSVLLYSTSASKYVATNTIQDNMAIIGGTF